LGFNGVLGGALPHYGSFGDAERHPVFLTTTPEKWAWLAFAAASRTTVSGR